MIARVSNTDLATKKAMVCFDERHGNLDVMHSRNHVRFDVTTELLREIGFTHSAGHHWRLLLDTEFLDRVAREISERMSTAVVWDCGKVYRRESDSRPDAGSRAPAFWEGERMP